MFEDFRIETDIKWNETIKDLFNGDVPNYSEWTSTQQIIDILNQLGKKKNTNHTFFPSGGGLDFSNCKNSIEKGCIELNYGGSIVVAKLTKLTFNAVNDKDFKSSYFCFYANGLKQSDVYENVSDEIYEVVAELSPGEYVDLEAYESGYWGFDLNGELQKVPSGTRRVRRLFNGKMLMVSKSSYYNQISSTYDGRHNKMSDDDLKTFITALDSEVK